MKNLIKYVKLRLQSSGENLHKDANGANVYINVDIFSDEQIKDALAMSESMFKQFNLDIAHNEDILVQGAVIQLLAGHALVESGRAYDYQNIKISDILNDQWKFEYQMYFRKLELMMYNKG